MGYNADTVWHVRFTVGLLRFAPSATDIATTVLTEVMGLVEAS